MVLGPGKVLVYSRRVGRRRKLTKVEEEFNQNVETKLVVTSKVVEVETPYDEQDGENDEATKLDWLTSEGINSGDGHPVSWNGTCSDENAITGSQVVEDLVNSWASAVADRGENSSAVETKTVESNIL